MLMPCKQDVMSIIPFRMKGQIFTAYIKLVTHCPKRKRGKRKKTNFKIFQIGEYHATEYD